MKGYTFCQLGIYNYVLFYDFYYKQKGLKRNLDDALIITM